MKIGKTRLETYTGDITACDVDAIVNPANNMLWTGGGVSARIRHEGGEAIEREALANAPAEIGSAVVTGGGALSAGHVIHAVIAGQDLATDEISVRKAMRAVFERARDRGFRSLALPLIDSIAHDIEIHVAARLIVDETVEALIGDSAALERVVLVEHDESMKGLFRGALEDVFSSHG